MNLFSGQDTQEDRWKRFCGCLAACSAWYTTVSTASSSSAICRCCLVPSTSSAFSAMWLVWEPAPKTFWASAPATTTVCWVESLARNHNIPIEWAEKGVRKEDCTRRALRRIELQKRFGVYFILQRMEVGTSFRSAAPPLPDQSERVLPQFRLPPRLPDSQDFRALLRAGAAAFECRQSHTDLRLAGAAENQRQAANGFAEDRARPACVARLLQQCGAADVSEVDNVVAGRGVEQPPERFWPQQGAGELGRGAPEAGRCQRPLRRLRSRVAPHAHGLPPIPALGATDPNSNAAESPASRFTTPACRG